MANGVVTILLFNLICQVGYKVFAICQSISEFLAKGSLPSEVAKKRNERIGCAILISSLALLAIYVILIVYWWFIRYNEEALRVCIFGFIILQSILFMVTSGLYFTTAWVLIKIKRNSNVDKNQKKLMKKQIFVWVLFSTYVVMWIAGGLLAYNLGSYSFGTFIVEVVISSFFILVKIEIFVVLVKFTLDIRLTTQLLHNSQVIIVGFDQFDR